MLQHFPSPATLFTVTLSLPKGLRSFGADDLRIFGEMPARPSGGPAPKYRRALAGSA
ncbi:hypothetical protein [Pararhodonellum marinum]|uniref:hypothetical protein n=1 Tax=Pararhodonellum marinum TaxID=2755358 RepID=UPI00188DDD01|nr:hypothetical protein [Pararhodonellum marinum]